MKAQEPYATLAQPEGRSYLLYRGRCSRCGMPIGVAEPMTKIGRTIQFDAICGPEGPSARSVEFIEHQCATITPQPAGQDQEPPATPPPPQEEQAPRG